LKAAVLKEFNKDLEVETLTIPDLQEGQVLVDIKFSGICGAQINQKKGIKMKDEFLPCLMGHEGSGIIIDIGKNVSTVKKGDHVVMHWRKSEGIESEFPKYYSKTSNQQIGSGLITTFSDKSIVSENRVTKIDKKHSLEVASLLGCAVTTGFGVINNELKPDEDGTFLISGVGGVGLSSIIGAKLNKAKDIIAIDINQKKLDFSKKIGSTQQIIYKKNKKIELKNLNKVEYAVDTTGDPYLINEIIDTLSPGGKLVLVGQPEKGRDLIIKNFIKLFNNIQIFDSQGGLTDPSKDIPLILDMHKNNTVDLKQLISKKIMLQEINMGFEILENHSLVGSRILIEN
tara:strand:- start:1898 stop:2926 length:1029 start_codon:yes stop_codon:yes gene_type:complete